MPPERKPYPLFHRHDSVSSSSQPYSVPSPLSAASNTENSASASASKSNRITTTSFIWEHGERRDHHWQCTHCGKRYKCGHGTSTARNHLKDTHGVEEGKPIP